MALTRVQRGRDANFAIFARFAVIS